MCRRFERILVFYCKDTQAVELEVPIALAAYSGKSEWFKLDPPVYRKSATERVALSTHALY